MIQKGDKVRHTTDGSGKVMVVIAVAERPDGLSHCSWTTPDGQHISGMFPTETLVLLPTDAVNYSSTDE